jgi:hypothetical protein
MNLVNGTARAATVAGEAATATLGAVGGAAVGGLVGTMKGAAEGARRGSHSTPAAVLTMGAVALTGVVQWPIVAAVGGTALVLDQLKPRTKSDTPKSAQQLTGTPATPGAGAKAAAVSAAPAGTAAESITPAPARKAVRGRRTPAKTLTAKTPTAKASPGPTP